ncbi:MAG: tripartite tricarboxylate transporter permease [Candidatus Binatia bacterium]
MFESLVTGLLGVLQWSSFSFMLIGIAIGLVVGIMPGLGSGTALVLMFPFVFRMEPVQAFAFLLGMASVVSTTGDLTSILFGIPGESDCAASVIDGHPLAKQGQAGRAMAASLMSSLIGAIFGGVVLVLAVPLVRPLVLSLGAAGMFMMGMLGITFIATLSGGDMLKGLIAGGLGLLLAMAGLDSYTATPRYTFGLYYLWDGVPLVPVTIGLFAIPEVVELAVKGGSIAQISSTKIGGVMEGIKDTFRHWMLVIRCSAIGALVGIMPGMGSGVGQFLAYAHAVQSSKNKERFGKGAIEGVIGPGAANNSKEGGSLIPTVAFGVPGGLHSALLLGAFTILGLTPGLAMLRPEQNLSLTYSLVWTIIIANLITVPLCFLFLKQLVYLTEVRGSILIPILLMLIYIGGFVTNTFGDMVMVLVFGALGWVMVTFGWLRPPLLIGLVLGDLVEKNLFIAVDAYGGFGWLKRPVVLVLLLIVLAGVVVPIYQYLKNPVRQRSESAGRWRFSYGALFSLGMVVAFAGALWTALSWPPRARIFPFAIFGPVLIIAIANFIKDLRRRPWTEAIEQTTAEANLDEASFRKRTREILTWILGFFLALWLLGFPLGIPLATFIYLKLGARESWLTSIVVTAGAWAFIVGVFGHFLDFIFPDPALSSLLAYMIHR